MTTPRSSGTRRHKTSFVVAALLLGAAALTLALKQAQEQTSRAEVPGALHQHERVARDHERQRVRPGEPAVEQSAAPTTAMDERGHALAGSPAPFDAADASAVYHFISVVDVDGKSELATVRPDHEGRFNLPAELRGRRVRLFALSEQGAVPLEHPLVVRSDDVEGQTVIFVAPRDTGQVTIRCVDDTGVGVRGRIDIERRFGEEWRTQKTVETEQAGSVLTQLAGAGEYRARLMRAESRSKKFVRPPEHRFTVESDARIAVEFVLPRPAEVLARVTDESGRPLAGALVNLLVFEIGQFRPHPAARTTGSDGCVRLTGIEPGSVILQVTQIGRLPAVRDIQAHSGIQEQVFSLAPGGARISGRFFGLPDEFPTFEHAGLHLLRVSDVTRENIVLSGPTLASDGSFDIPGVPAGRYQLTLSLRGFGDTMVWFSVPQTGAAELGAIDLNRVLEVGALELNVRVEADDRAHEYAPRVLYRRDDWPAAVWRPVSMWIGDTVRVSGLAEGTYRLQLSPQAYDPDAWDLSDTTTVAVVAEAIAPTAVLRIRRK